MISKDVCQRVLQKAVSTGADYAEIFAEKLVRIRVSASEHMVYVESVYVFAEKPVHDAKQSKRIRTARKSDENALVFGKKSEYCVRFSGFAPEYIGKTHSSCSTSVVINFVYSPIQRRGTVFTSP